MEGRTIRNRKINPRRKFDPASIADIDEHVTSLRSAIAEGELVVKELESSPAWEILCRNWKAQLEHVEDQLDNFHTLTDKGRDFALKERQDLISNLTILEVIEAKAANYRAEMAEAIASLTARKERVGTTQE